MDGQNGKKAHFPIGCTLFLIITAFIISELAFNTPFAWKQVNDAPDVSAEYRGTNIVLDSDRHYILVSTYVFSNKGNKPVSFDACYESAASYNGTALKRIYANDDRTTEANDEVQPGAVIALQVGYSLPNFMPGQSANAKIKVKLTERFGEMNVIHQTEQKASELSVKEVNPFCRVC